MNPGIQFDANKAKSKAPASKQVEKKKTTHAETLEKVHSPQIHEAKKQDDNKVVLVTTGAGLIFAYMWLK